MYRRAQLWQLYQSVSIILLRLKIQRCSIFVPIIDSILSLYFRFHSLSPCTIELDSETSMHFWVPKHPHSSRPNLVLLHGFGASSKWQFMHQVPPLAKSFNLYLPDLLFFGGSHTTSGERTETFQAQCVREGVRRLGVETCSVYSISYGGFVGYRMAQMYPQMVDKVVIVSSGIGCTARQKGEQLKNVGANVFDLFLPSNPKDLRTLVNLSIYKFNPFKWLPDVFLTEFINMTCETNRKEKRELLEHLLANQAACETSVLTQDALLVWGDKDKIFPLTFAYQLQRKLGPKVKLEILKDTGHAANIESYGPLNKLIKSFVLSPKKPQEIRQL